MADTQYNSTGWLAQMDVIFANNTNGDIDPADIRQTMRDGGVSFAFTADENIFSEDNVLGEADHVTVFGNTAVPNYNNTNEVKPRVHIFSADKHAIRIENTDNADVDTTAWTIGQQDAGDLIFSRVADASGTYSYNTWLLVDQNSDILQGSTGTVTVFGNTSLPGYSNTNEVKPRMHIFSTDKHAIRIENTDNATAATTAWTIGQQDAGDLIFMRVADASGTYSYNTWLTVDQNNKTVFEGNSEFGNGITGTSTVTVNNGTMTNGEERSFVAKGAVSGGSERSVRLAVYKNSSLTEACTYLLLQSEDGATNRIWADNNDVLRISTTAGNIGTTAGTVVGTQTSDERLKENLRSLTYGLKELIELPTFTYEKNGVTEIGFSAQKTREIIPEAVYDTNEKLEGDDETILAMDYSKIIPVLVNAIKELAKR